MTTYTMTSRGEMRRCATCDQPTVYTSGVCRYCQAESKRAPVTTSEWRCDCCHHPMSEPVRLSDGKLYSPCCASRNYSRQTHASTAIRQG